MLGVDTNRYRISYEDVEDVLVALRKYERLWTQERLKTKGSQIRVYHDWRTLEMHGQFEAGVVETK